MAGSYHHVLNGWSLIENMGDAAEAVEEPMWLVESQIGAKKAIDNDTIPGAIQFIYRLYCSRQRFSYAWILVFHDSAVKVNGENNHYSISNMAFTVPDNSFPSKMVLD